jgi:hypothetical protein
MRLAVCWLWEQVTHGLWGLAGWRPGRLAALHLRAESRLRREEAKRDGRG